MVEMSTVDKGIEATVRVDECVDSDVMARSISDAGKSLKFAFSGVAVILHCQSAQYRRVHHFSGGFAD